MEAREVQPTMQHAGQPSRHARENVIIPESPRDRVGVMVDPPPEREKTVEEGPSVQQFRVETRPFSHKYYIRRPRALQYFQDGQFIDAGVNRHPSNEMPSNEEPPPIMWSSSRQRVATAKILLPNGMDADSRSTDIPVVQRRRLDLFIDLLWVGISSNLSERFSDAAFTADSSYGQAFLEYIILFFIAWQIWNYLREFLNSFYVDDLLQRSFIIWILILALLYGNSATYFNVSRNATEVIIVIYLIARGSFTLMEAIYVFFLPQLRTQYIIRTLGFIPVVGLFIGSIFVPWPTSVALYFPAIVLEAILQNMSMSPLQDSLLRGQFRKAPDPDHLIERFESFFIIILGEGVFLLIKSSPLGLGIGTFSGSGIMVLSVYYFVFVLYFASDQSRNYIHAVRRSWLTATIWQTLHIFLYSSILLADASWLFLIQNSANDLSSLPASSVPRKAETSDPASEILSTSDRRLLRAKWTVCVSLATTLVTTTAISLLNRSLDPPNTLMINTRLARLTPRIALAVIYCFINLKGDLGPQSIMAVVFGSLWLLAHWEWYCGLERGAKFIEPKVSKD